MTRSWLRPASLDAALRALAAETPPRLFAGGTDIFAAEAFRTAWGQPPDGDTLDIDAIPGLEGIEKRDGVWRIGARTRWAGIRDASLPAFFDGLRQAAGQVGGPQIQSRGTIAGNLCNASPAADGVPPLLSLEAEVECASLSGTRNLPLNEFILGNRRTALRPGEMVTAILVPDRTASTRAAFLKLGARRNLVISIAMAAATLDVVNGRIIKASVALGACSPVAVRLTALEADLVGLAPGEAAEAVTADHLSGIAPIDDVRASADYRREAAAALLRRLLAAMAETMLTEAA
ncbi:FAD binding domain-containing protein [Acetobacteraceae bacterium H6797]|nr:FAD binding domain-containing protein [Acetobacteraceae bacterium H6797]